MSNNKYPVLLISHPRYDDSDFSENDYKNKDFKIQKYEKFKPKKSSLKKDLIGAENQIKNILSVFLETYESEKKNSDIIFNVEQDNKNKERHSISNRNKKSHIKKTSTFNKCKDDFLRSSSLNIQVNKNNFSNNFVKTPEISNLKPNLIHKKKVSFNLNPIENTNVSVQKEVSYLTRKKTKNKNNSLIKNNDIQVSKTLKLKEKISDLVKRTKSFGSEIFKIKKKNSKEIKGDLINSKQNGSKNNNLHKSSSLIKINSLTIQNYNNNSYYNFKNDNYILNRSNNDSMRHSLKKKKELSKIQKRANLIYLMIHVIIIIVL